MSTRCVISFADEDDSFSVYEHADGYPGGIHGVLEAAVELCPRTLCLWKPGVPQEGMKCWYSWTGKIPCTGVLRCQTCGRIKED